MLPKTNENFPTEAKRILANAIKYLRNQWKEELRKEDHPSKDKIMALGKKYRDAIQIIFKLWYDTR